MLRTDDPSGNFRRGLIVSRNTVEPYEPGLNGQKLVLTSTRGKTT